MGVVCYLLGDDSSGTDTLGSLGDEEHTSLLDGLVDVVALVGTVRNVIVSNIIDLVLFEKFNIDYPGAVLDNLIDPLAVSDCLCSFLAAKDSKTFPPVRLLVASHTDDEIGIGEGGFGLFKLTHMTAEIKG